MRVVSLTSRYSMDAPGGVESVVREIVPRLQARMPNVHVRGVHAFAGPTRWNRLPLLGDIVAAIILSRRTLADDFTIVNGAEYAWLRALLPSVRHKTALVWHGTRTFEIPAIAKRLTPAVRIYIAAQELLGRLSLRLDRHFAVSEKVRTEIAQAFNYHDEVRLVLNGAPAAAPSEPDIKRDHATVLWIGTTEYLKGLDRALAAVDAAREKIPDLRLRLVGLPDRPPDLPEWADFAGRLAPSAMRREYRKATILCAASRYEACSVAVIEAMQAELPVAAGAAVAWMIDDAATAAPLDEQIQTLLTSPQARDQRIACQNRSLSRFSWDTVIDEFERAINDAGIR